MEVCRLKRFGIILFFESVFESLGVHLVTSHRHIHLHLFTHHHDTRWQSSSLEGKV